MSQMAFPKEHAPPKPEWVKVRLGGVPKRTWVGVDPQRNLAFRPVQHEARTFYNGMWWQWNAPADEWFPVETPPLPVTED